MPHKDPDAAKAYFAAYRATRREKAKQATAAWRDANPGKNAEISRRWREQNPEKAKAKQRTYRQANREKIREKQREWRARTGYNQQRRERGEGTAQQLRLYGLTQETYAALLAAQGGGCAICGASAPGMKNAKRLYVDHCHSTGRVRGILCMPCNSMLGRAKDRPDILRTGAAYLERDGCSPVCGDGRDILESR